MNETASKLLVDGAASIGVALNTAQLERFEIYLRELLSWNRQFNLTAITDEREVIVKHFLDSIALLGALDVPQGVAAVDIGAGAGFPGIPLKIARPDIKLTLLESSRKKASFLTHISEALKLEQVTVVAERAETFGRSPKNREKFQLALARAVADIAVLVEYALPLVIEGGRFVCYKAKGVHEELERAKKAIPLLGGCVEEVAKVVVPFLNAERYLVSIKKVAATPAAYPRKPGTPAKRPLA